MADDLSQIVTGLADHAEAVCRKYLPAGRRQGNYWTVGDVRNAPGRSLWVRLTDDASGRPAGRWQDGESGEYGDLLDIIREARHLTRFVDVLNEATDFLGLPTSRMDGSDKPREQRSASASQRAARLFAAAKPVRATLAERYLRGRGLANCGILPALRFHPQCYHLSDDGGSLSSPALIAAATDDDGRLTGVLRTYLDPNGFADATLGKASIDTPKKALGDLLGHAVRFGRPGPVLAAGEGLETVLSLRTVAPALPHAAALSAGHLAALTLPAALRRLYVIRDNDAAGRWATSRLTRRAAEAGIEAVVITPYAKDLNEDLRRMGPAGLLAHVRDQFTADDASQYLPFATR